MIAVLAAGLLALFGLAMAGSASAQPSAHRHSAAAVRIKHSAQPSPIKHVVVLYLENHSFDNLLGYFCNQHPGRCPDGGMPSFVTLSNGAVVTPGVMPDIVPNVLHTVQSQRKAIDGGVMDGWQEVLGCGPRTGYACVGGYEPTAIPNLTTLASNFAISDHTFSMANSLITWDDCGCFYDQVPPGVNPDGTPQGPRSPLVIVSPFARPGFTDTTPTTFAGILGFVDQNFGLQPLGPSDAGAYTFSDAFDFRQAPLKPARMIYRKWPKDAYHVNMSEARQDT